jgi:hypothetical protein
MHQHRSTAIIARYGSWATYPCAGLLSECHCQKTASNRRIWPVLNISGFLVLARLYTLISRWQISRPRALLW